MLTKRFWIKYLWATAAKATTFIPFVVGATSMLLSVPVERPTSSMLFLGGFVSCLVAVGTFVTRLYLADENSAGKTVKQVLLEIEQEDAQARHAKREKALDNLAKLLCQDGDDRTDIALADLRRVVKMYEELQARWKGKIKALSLQDTFSKVEEIFTECVALLLSSYKDYVERSQIRTLQLRKVIEERREAKVRKVQSTLEELTRGLVSAEEVVVREADIGGQFESRLTQLGQEFKERLDFAKSVDTTADEIRKEFGVETPRKRSVDPFDELLNS